MSRWKQSYESHRRYKEKWEKQFTWLEKMADDSENAFCKLCCKILQPKLSTIINHSKTADHITQEEFYLQETMDGTQDCHLDDEPCEDEMYDEWDSDEECEEAKEFGSYVTESLLNLNSDENREKLKELIRKAVQSVTELDITQTTDTPQRKLECERASSNSSEKTLKPKVVVVKLPRQP